MTNDEAAAIGNEMAKKFKEAGWAFVFVARGGTNKGFSIGAGSKAELATMLYAVIDRATDGRKGDFLAVCKMLMDVRREEA